VSDKLTIRVRVQPRGSKGGIMGVLDGHLKIKTTAAPTDGQANRDVIRQLARAFQVPPSRVTWKSGASGRLKTFVVEDPQALPEWLADVSSR